MATQLPLDYQTEQEALARQQAWLDAQRMDRMQTASRGEANFGHLISARMGRGDQEALDKRKADFNARYASGLSDAVQNYYKTREGAPASIQPDSMGPPDAEGMTQPKVTPGQAANPRKAAIDAIVSSFPQLREIGLADLKPQKRNLADVNGIVYDKDTGSVVELSGARPSQVMHNGDLYEQSPSTGAWRKLDNAPRVTVAPSIAVNAQGEGTFMKHMGEQTAKQIGEVQQSKVNAQRMLSTADRLEQLNAAGTFSGPTANFGTSVAQFADALGVPVDRNKLNNSQEYQALLGKKVAEVLTASGGVGRSMTDADREAFMSQFPQLVNSPQGRQRIISLLRSSAKQDIGYADQVQANLEKTYPEAAKLFGIAPSQQALPPAQNASSKAISLEDYLRQLRGGK